MSRAARSVRAFSLYLWVLGVILATVPNMLLTAFGFPETQEIWIRVLGIIVFNLGVYYWFGAAGDARPFLWATVATRTLVVVSFTALVVIGLARPMLILFGLVDGAGGAWTAWALRRDTSPHPVTNSTGPRGA